MVKRTKAIVKRKSRTIARPALYGKAFFVLGCFIFSMLILCQVISVRLVLALTESPAPQNTVRVTPSAIQERRAQATSHSSNGLPMRLKIPSIRVNAVIGHVGILGNGSMGLPKGPSETAWYMLGAKPGDKGSAVIAGHVDWWYGVTGVFARLKTLKPGDIITVEDDKGVSNSFVVRKSKEYGLKENASDVFLSSDGKSHLNLVTCSGIWNRIAKAYTKRYVVFADKVVK